MRRREFISPLGGGGVTVRGARAAGQQNSPHRRVVAFFSIGHGTLTPNVFATP